MFNAQDLNISRFLRSVVFSVLFTSVYGYPAIIMKKMYMKAWMDPTSQVENAFTGMEAESTSEESFVSHTLSSRATLHISRPMADGFIILGAFLAFLGILFGVGLTTAYFSRRRRSRRLQRATGRIALPMIGSQEISPFDDVHEEGIEPTPARLKAATTPSASDDEDITAASDAFDHKERQRWLAGWWSENLQRRSVMIDGSDLPYALTQMSSSDSITSSTAIDHNPGMYSTEDLPYPIITITHSGSGSTLGSQAGGSSSSGRSGF